MLCSTYMIILPSTSIHQFIMKLAPSTIIGPHGMTDFIHANKYKIIDKLYRINMGTVAVTFGCHMIHQDALVNALFLASSVIHFRNDMPFFGTSNSTKAALQTTMSGMLVASGTFLSWDVFMYYMLFIHVPNHYRIQYPHIKHALPQTIMLVGGLASILTAIGYSPLENPYLDWFSKGLIIAHVIYEEVYIFRSVSIKR